MVRRIAEKETLVLIFESRDEERGSPTSMLEPVIVLVNAFNTYK